MLIENISTQYEASILGWCVKDMLRTKDPFCGTYLDHQSIARFFQSVCEIAKRDNVWGRPGEEVVAHYWHEFGRVMERAKARGE